MKAVILAGGEGTRLRPLTSNQPKPMLTVANRPMMEHVVCLLVDHGFDEIVVTVAFLANQIRDYFGDGAEFGVPMRFATEENLLGTAGSVRNAVEELADTFVVISGDVLTDVDLTALVAAHRSSGAAATIALKRVEDPVEFGIVICDEAGKIERFLEKPTWGEVFSDTINTGIYVLEPQVFEFIAAGEVVDFAQDVFPAMLEAGLGLHGHIFEGYWEDVGTLEAYVRCHGDVLDNRVSVGVPGFGIGEGIWLGEGSEVDPEATLNGPVVIGSNTRVEAGAVLQPYTVLGDGVVVKAGAIIERAVVHDHVYVGPGVRLRGTVVGRSTNFREGARADEGVVIGEQCLIGEHAVINPGVRVYPFKTVEADAVVNSSIVWETRGPRVLFGRRGVSGLANVDVTPELAVRVAMAFGTSLKKGSVVTTSRDTSRAARALKRAVIAGLNLTGVHVEDLEMAPVPITRFHVRGEHAQAGVTVRLTPGDADSVEIRLFDTSGCDIDEATQRKIERLYYREDFRRAFSSDIGEIVFPARAIEYYTSALSRSVDAPAIRERGFKVVLDYSYGAASALMPNVLSKIGAEVLGVNPFANTASALFAETDRASQINKVARLVKASGSDLGVVIDTDGETVVLIDDEGVVLSHEQALLICLELAAAKTPSIRCALPVSASRAAERVVSQHGGTITWTKLSAGHLTAVAAAGSIDFAASQDGGFIWPDFLPAYDAIATVVKLLDLLVLRQGKLSDMTKLLPEVSITHESIATPWERKGAIMREIIEGARDADLILVDGAKFQISESSWALVLPDPEVALTHVWAEGAGELDARRIAREFSTRIRELLV